MDRQVEKEGQKGWKEREKEQDGREQFSQDFLVMINHLLQQMRNWQFTSKN